MQKKCKAELQRRDDLIERLRYIWEMLDLKYKDKRVRGR